MIDYHVHTSLCNHATGTMEEYVQAAVNRGMDTLCFLDHLTLQEAGSYNAMRTDQLPGYVAEARRLGQAYQDRIDVRVGLEVDFSPDHVEQCVDLIENSDLDVVGSSLHYLDGEDVVTRRSAWARGELDPEEVYARYLAAMDLMLDYDYFDVICHMDLPKKYGQRPSPGVISGFVALLEKIRKKGLAVELNTSGFYYAVAEAFPSPELLTHCARLDIPVVFSSDAHSPATVGRDYARAMDLLQAAGYKKLAGFFRRQREIVAM